MRHTLKTFSLMADQKYYFAKNKAYVLYVLQL